MKKYSINYEGGKCPLGYVYVEGHMSRNIWIDPFCRKLPKYRFSDPDTKEREQKAKMEAESMERAKKIYWATRGSQKLGEDELE